MDPLLKAPTSTSPLCYLPNEMCSTILRKLDITSLRRLLCCNKRLRELCVDPILWKEESDELLKVFKKCNPTVLRTIRMPQPNYAEETDDSYRIAQTYTNWFSILLKLGSWEVLNQLYINMRSSTSTSQVHLIRQKILGKMRSLVRKQAQNHIFTVKEEHCTSLEYWKFWLDALDQTPEISHMAFKQIPSTPQFTCLVEKMKQGTCNITGFSFTDYPHMSKDTEAEMVNIIQNCRQLKYLDCSKLWLSNTLNLPIALCYNTSLEEIKLPHFPLNGDFHRYVRSVMLHACIKRISLYCRTEEQRSRLVQICYNSKWKWFTIRGTSYHKKGSLHWRKALEQCSSQERIKIVLRK